MPQKSGRPIPVAGTALLLIDVLSHFRFPDGAAVLRGLRRNLPALTRLVSRSRRAGVPLIYVNDNLGKWRSDQAEILAICFQARAMGRDVVRALSPGPSDNFVLKPRHSGFYCTPLELLLAGTATNSCIWLTAFDAHIRHYELIIVSDGTAASTPALQRQALSLMRSTLGARTIRADSVRFRG